MKYKKRSVLTKIANYLLLIIIFAGIISSLSLAIMLGNKSDAELINIAGSLRMQSYRLIYEMDYAPDQIDINLKKYRLSLHSSALNEINTKFFISDEAKVAYKNLIKRWELMEHYVYSNNGQAYRQNIHNYVDQVDKFVSILQYVAEKKLYIAIVCIFISMLSIIAMVSYVIWFTKKEVVSPLEKLALASTQVQIGQFNHLPLDIHKNNEIGRLSEVFTQMSSELQKLYAKLEEKVNEKTIKLRQVNHSLTMLYHCSQLATTSSISPKLLQQILKQVLINEHLRYIELIVHGAEHWNIQLGEKQDHFSCQQTLLTIEGQELGVIAWQAGLPCPDLRTMHSVSQMLSRTLYFYNMQRQQQHLLLMEERSIIARELHDSLAQVLSYLKIQLKLLKHTINKNNLEYKDKENSLLIIHDFEQALTAGYQQLRELLATFRLNVQEANLQIALEQVIDSLRNQTDIKMKVHCALPSQTFSAQQLVHVLQIVREATLNAIKHSQASLIEVVADINDDGEYQLLVRDNGIGISSLEEPEGHYGLNIMQERAQKLNAKLMIKRRDIGGTEVQMVFPITLQ
ncbi:two-component system sensor histidine kinase NarQ [Bisgaardia hudsonensis]|nr:nitrate/nitrite two-component system sensor histidine kinase NarQ [Bisgaardia hudsonensis]QLB13946.1 two-component system sensor histidine kinase NarQ [Bisgaardia hudsonensis]